MIKRTVTTSILAMMGICLSFSLSAQPVLEAPKFDPYLPGELNERALYALQVNDVETALILLERAYRLNPNSPDIKANLGIVRNIAQENALVSVTGEVIYLDPLGNSVSSEKVVDVPPLWPETKP
jgi:tetratricopeptide (TPR) repeat protein